MLLECVINVSEGRDARILAELSGAAGTTLLDRHADPDHHRAVLTLGGPAEAVETAARAVAEVAVGRLDLRRHQGAHPRFGVVDVVPFVPLTPPADLVPAAAARDRFAAWAWDALGVPSFLYGPLPGGRARTLPEVRREAFVTLQPDVGGPGPDPSAGATAVGARPVLVAYNLWLADVDAPTAAAVARALRGPAVRALGFNLAGSAQVSTNLLAPLEVGPADVYDRVSSLVGRSGGTVARAEVVGLVPAGVLAVTPSARWAQLGLDGAATIEGRLEARGLRTRSS